MMTDLNVIFNELVRDIIWPNFKALGYKRTGNNFRYFGSPDWGRIVQFQKSQWNSAANISFTINVGFYLRDVDYFISPRNLKENFEECACVVRKRISSSKNSLDKWYELNDSVNKLALFTQVSADITQYVIPYLATVNSREDIYAILVKGHQSDYPPAQIQAMYQAGYHEPAIKLLRAEWSRSKPNPFYRNTLAALMAELDVPVQNLAHPL